jgi:hypothetical protein
MNKLHYRLLLSLLLLWTLPLYAQRGDWYTYSTGKGPVCHIRLGDDELVVENMDPALRQLKLSGAAGKTGGEERIEARRITANGRTYYIHLSPDALYFVTTFQYFKEKDSLLMYCADGIDDGYKTMADAIKAIKQDSGRHFSITLYTKEQLDQQKRRQSVTKATSEEFSAALQQFNQTMDQFWQYRGYGRFEPYHTWMNLIYGNAFADSFGPQCNKLSLTAANLKIPIANYSTDPAIKKQLEEAGLLQATEP